MKRDLKDLANRKYDVLVVGGGITGACIAWDAVLRGLSVAIVEKGDFAQATSANSLKTVHGGLRYLQDLDVHLVRKMIYERKSLLRVAPHLVHPLSCIMPTYTRLMRSRLALTAALKLNDWMGFDRNRGQDPHKYLPNSKVISREECFRILPGLPREGVTGAAVWYDGQMYNSERLALAFVRSAVEAGAAAANYAEVLRFLKMGERVIGARVRDVLSGSELEVQASCVVNATGPWVDRLASSLNGQVQKPLFNHSLAVNLVTRELVPMFAAGVPTHPDKIKRSAAGNEKSQILFIAPWRGYSIVGTFHSPYRGVPEDHVVTEQEIQTYVDLVNSAYPSADLKISDVRLVHRGFLPARKTTPDRVKLVREGSVYDHKRHDGIDGLVTVVGVKYTSARGLAQKAVDVVVAKLGRTTASCRTDVQPVFGGDIKRFDEFYQSALYNLQPEMTAEDMKRLVFNYGTAYPQVLALQQEVAGSANPVCPTLSISRAEVLYAIRDEMACKLSDVVFRRTEAGSATMPDDDCLRCIAETMALELGWDRTRTEVEIQEVKAVYQIG